MDLAGGSLELFARRNFDYVSIGEDDDTLGVLDKRYQLVDELVVDSVNVLLL